MALKKNNKPNLVLALCVFLIIAGCFIVLVVKNSSTSTLNVPTPTTTVQYALVSNIQALNNDQLLLTSNKLGVKIRYPKFVTFAERPTGYKSKRYDGLEFFIYQTNIDSNITVDVINYVDNRDLAALSRDFYKDNSKQAKKTIKPVSPVLIGNRAAYEYAYTYVQNDNGKTLTNLSYRYLIEKNEGSYYSIIVTVSKDQEVMDAVSKSMIDSLEFFE